MKPQSPRPLFSPTAWRVAAVSMTLLLALGLYLEGFPAPLWLGLSGLLSLVCCAVLVRPEGAQCQGALLSVASLALALLIGDASLRILLAPKLYYRPDELLLEKDPGFPMLSRFQPEARADWESFGDLAAMAAPGTPRRLRHLNFEIDARGYRNSTLPGPPYQALLLGDSFAYGSGVRQSETWAARLGSQHGIATYNLGFPANPWQELLLLQAHIADIPLVPGATIIWSLFGGNDLGGEFGALELPSPQNSVGALRTRLFSYRKRSPLRQLLARIQSSSHGPDSPVHVVQRGAGLPPLLFYRAYNQEALRRSLSDSEAKPLRSVLREMARLISSRGLRLVLVSIPTKYEIYSSHIPDAPPPPVPSAFTAFLQQECRQLGLDLLNLRPHLERAAQEEADLLWLEDDTHWNAAGHRIAAQAVHRRWFSEN